MYGQQIQLENVQKKKKDHVNMYCEPDYDTLFALDQDEVSMRQYWAHRQGK